jgi:hypothetical protein
MEISLAIIGTAGRLDDEKRLSKESFGAMCLVAEELIKQLGENNYPVTHLVSGGSAWADHVAVKLFLNKKVSNLRVFIPCQFENGMFTDIIPVRVIHGVNKQFEPGSTLNVLHNKFSRKVGIHSLTEIHLAQIEGAEILPCKGGFYGRNAMVAKSDILLAMTFGEGRTVKEGGTADTVRRYLTRVYKEGFFDKSFHYNLSDGKIYKGIEALAKEVKKTGK